MKDDEIIQVNKEDLHELLIKFTDSHRESQSQFWGEVKSEMKDLKGEVKEIKDSFTTWQKEQDAKIDDLEDAKTDIKSSFKGAKWIGGGAIGIILVLVGTISKIGYSYYVKDLSGIEKDIAAVKTSFVSHENRDNSSYMELVRLIKEQK